MLHGDVENNLDSKALFFSQRLALDAASVTAGTSSVAFDLCSWLTVIGASQSFLAVGKAA